MVEQVPGYPLILVHGFLGFARVLRASYWNGIAEALQAAGAQVHVVRVSAVNSNEIRGEQLRSHVARVLAQTGASKAHLLGHSQGALACRYAAALEPHKVASVTSLSGPHLGSELADLLAERAPVHGGS